MRVHLDGSKMQPAEFDRIEKGWHIFKIIKIEEPESDNALVDIVAQVVGKSDPEVGKKHRIRVFKNGLFVLGNILRAVGYQIPSKAFSFDLEKLVGKIFKGLLDKQQDRNDPDKEYDRIVRYESKDFTPPSASTKKAAEPEEEPEDIDMEEEEKKPRKPPKKASKKDDDDDDLGIEEIGEEDL